MEQAPQQVFAPRFWRFSLRSLLVLVAVAAIGLAWVHSAQQQRAAVAAMLKSNPAAAVLYDYEVEDDGGLNQPGTPPGPEWLRERLGVDYVSDVAGIDMFYPTDADLRCVVRFPRLERLHLERSIDLTDAGLVQLASLKHLKRLVLGEADQVTDAGLLQLAKLRNLRVVRMDRGRRMTSAGIEALRAALPNCRIEVRESPEEELAHVPSSLTNPKRKRGLFVGPVVRRSLACASG